MIRKIFFTFLVFFACSQWVNAQRGVGLRFAGDFNYFSHARDYQTVDGWFSNSRLGLFYQAVFKNGGFKAGLNFLYKPKGSGLPLIMRDFRPGMNTSTTAVEFDLRVGPRFWFLTPAIGFVMAYRFGESRWLESYATQHVNRFNVSFPVGCSFDWPTGYGSVGFGVFYNMGITNVDSDPIPGDGIAYDGSKMRTLSFEITNVFASGKQEKKNKPEKPKPLE